MNKISDFTSDISRLSKEKSIDIMEVCGTHTMEIAKNGLTQILPEKINLISGPGCPVCVTPASDIDWILEIINSYDLITFTFGDMLRVPGTKSSLDIEKSKGKKIKICYSPLDSLKYAESHPSELVLFIAIGFETTIPLTAVIAKRAHEKKIQNFFIFNTHKIIPPALEALLNDKDIKINGLILPGHVSAIIGSKPYEFIPEKYNVPCVISGFESFDILLSIRDILWQLKSKLPKVEIEYKRVVKETGNPVAVNEIYNVFEIDDSFWRGIGKIPCSGLKLKEKYINLDAKTNFPIKKITSIEPPGCDCGLVLKGVKKPYDCKLFLKVCNPDNPIGPCMVSSEGTCAAYFRYQRYN
jgi:hydrogenase expression/formation protein HypD